MQCSDEQEDEVVDADLSIVLPGSNEEVAEDLAPGRREELSRDLRAPIKWLNELAEPIRFRYPEQFILGSSAWKDVRGEVDPMTLQVVTWIFLKAVKQEAILLRQEEREGRGEVARVQGNATLVDCRAYLGKYEAILDRVHVIAKRHRVNPAVAWEIIAGASFTRVLLDRQAYLLDLTKARIWADEWARQAEENHDSRPAQEARRREFLKEVGEVLGWHEKVNRSDTWPRRTHNLKLLYEHMKTEWDLPDWPGLYTWNASDTIRQLWGKVSSQNGNTEP